MLALRPFCSAIGKLYIKLNDKREPVLEAVVNLANELYSLHPRPEPADGERTYNRNIRIDCKREGLSALQIILIST